MTARLVALMSALLFLSLLAFILLVRQSEEAVMAEVGKTVSKVGLETVRAVMSHGMASPAGSPDGEDEGAAVPGGWGVHRSFVVRHTGVDIAEEEIVHADSALPRMSEGTDGEEVPATSTGPTELRMEAVGTADLTSFAKQEAAQVIPEETATGTRYRIVLAGPESGAPSGLLELVWAGSDGKAPSRGLLRRAGLCRALLGFDGAGIEYSEIGLPRMPVQVDTEKDGTMQVAIRLVAAGGDLDDPIALAGFPAAAGPDTDGGAMLFIGGMTPDLAAPGADVVFDLKNSSDGVTEHQTVFQMSTRDYGAVFEALRGRMWALFAAVALVGTLLSAGLARRFTRPVRDLDTAIRRLSRDDLDVQVEVRGGGEVGRLTTAFNEMARRLRIARERSREVTRRERLSALGRLAAGVAHDVRNPLHSINLSLQHLLETCRPDEPAGQEFDRTVGIIRGEIRRLDGLVSNFLRFARTGVGDRRAVSVDHLLRETGDVVAKEALARGVEVRVFADSQGAVVLAEGDSLRSALLNLVLNSFEATPKGGVISLRSRLQDGVVTLEVADTGAGIPAEDREQIFDFGFTSREDGHGLGLAMVHEIVVEENDGRIEVESDLGVGTTIRIDLPVFQRETAEASA